MVNATDQNVAKKVLVLGLLIIEIFYNFPALSSSFPRRLRVSSLPYFQEIPPGVTRLAYTERTSFFWEKFESKVVRQPFFPHFSIFLFIASVAVDATAPGVPQVAVHILPCLHVQEVSENDPGTPGRTICSSPCVESCHCGNGLFLPSSYFVERRCFSDECVEKNKALNGIECFFWWSGGGGGVWGV